MSKDARYSNWMSEESLLNQSLDSIDNSLIYNNNEKNTYGSINGTERKNTLVTMSDYDQFSVHTTCPHCQQETDTQLRHHMGSATFKCCALLMIFTCGLLSWLPFIMKDFKDVDHICQHCGEIVGTYKRNFISS